MTPPPALEVQALSAGYGASQALFAVDLTVGHGELVALIGSNGAGKSTLLRAVSGMLPVWSGRVRLNGTPITGQPPERIVRAGLAHCPEGRRVFGELTVRENLLMGAYTRPRDQAREALARVVALFPRLADRQRQPAGTLSGGEQQMLAIGRAIMSGPRVLLLDEPSLGLAPVIVDHVLDAVQAIAADGMTTVLVEQNARLALSIASRGYVLEAGRIVKEGTGRELSDDPAVQRAYLGI